MHHFYEANEMQAHDFKHLRSIRLHILTTHNILASILTVWITGQLYPIPTKRESGSFKQMKHEWNRTHTL